MSYQLTAGSCEQLQTAAPSDAAIFDSPHTIQFLSIKKVSNPSTSNSAPVDRYRIIISDGVHFTQAMLATQLNNMVVEGTITKHSVAVVEKATCNTVQGKRLIILLSLNVIGQPNEKLGDPKQLEVDPASVRQDGQAAVPNSAVPAQSTSAPDPPKPQPALTRGGGGSRSSIYPIEGLSPYQNNWTIKARVTQKSDMKTWSNARGEGKLFNVTLMDESGEIRATAFNLVADDLYPRLEEGKVYYISKARVNLAKKKFSNLANDYELALEKNTEIEECHDTVNLPAIRYNFVPLSGLSNIAKDGVCDVIGVLKEVGDIGQITSKATDRQITKRELTLVDKSNFQVRLTLWGKQAEQFSVEDKAILAFKGVRVNDFGGRSLSMISTSTMQVNPDIQECFDLRGWYDSGGEHVNFTAHTNAGGGSIAAASFERSQVQPLEQVKQAQYGFPDKPSTFFARGTITHIKSDSLYYPACRTEGCNKKVVETSGFWRCEKCDKSFDSPEHRYIMSICVADYSGQVWLQGFNDVGLMVFGMTADQLIALKENDENDYNIAIQRAHARTYNFACRAKQDNFNESTRIRYGITRMYKINWREEANYLRDLLYSL